MALIKRDLENRLRRRLGSGKALIIMGARQVGKTTLLHQLLDGDEGVLWLTGDEQDVRDMMESATAVRLRQFFGKHSTVVIDEAQRIADVGIKLKLITDYLKEYQLIATGSSSFELANRINEPLTGRKWEFRMFPLSFSEMVQHTDLLQEKRMLPHRLVYGYYPDVVAHEADARQILSQLADSYLFKDVFQFGLIHKPDNLIKLLKALAYQVGSEVSNAELAQLCGLDAKTVEKYITVLEQSYIIFRLGSYSSNLRNELKFKRKIYFVDNGVRNALISAFDPAETRTDVGALFENFVVSERMKLNVASGRFAEGYFWRTKQKQEIDYVEKTGQSLSAFEFKWNPKRKASAPATFTKAYPEAKFTVVNRDNIQDFLLPAE